MRFPARQPSGDALWHALAATAMLVGAAWRITQYLRHASLYVDEAALALGVLNNDMAGLFDRLDYGQVAPIGFLLAVKTCTILFGTSEWSLRLFPLLCGLAALPTFYLVAGRLLERPAAAVATVLFSLAAPLALWSTLFKQYSCDVLFSLIAVAAAHRVISGDADARSIRVAAIAGAIAAFFSHGALLVLAACGIVVIADGLLSHRAQLRARLLAGVAWAAAVLPTVWWTRHLQTPADSAYMRRFWDASFMPLELPSMVSWLWLRFHIMIADDPWLNGALYYAMPKLWAVLAAAGALAAARRGPSGVLLLMPFVVTAAASMARAYPLGGRAGLFLVPLGLLLAVGGARQIAAWAGGRAANLVPLLLIPFAVVSFNKYRPNFMPEHLRPDVEYLAAHVQPGDRVWVYYGAARAFEYYARRIPIGASASFGHCDRTDASANLRQLDSLRGAQRAWIVVTHATPEEQQAMLHYLDAIGVKQDAYSATPRKPSVTASAVYLYRLDDPARWHNPAAASIRLPPIAQPAAWSCYGTMSRTPEGDHRAIEDLR